MPCRNIHFSSNFATFSSVTSYQYSKCYQNSNRLKRFIYHLINTKCIVFKDANCEPNNNYNNKAVIFGMLNYSFSLQVNTCSTNFAVITATGVLGYCYKVCAPRSWNFVHSLQNSSSSVRLDGGTVCEYQFSSLSELDLDLDFECVKILIYLDLYHSIVAVVICIGALSCWKVNLFPNLKSFVE